MVYNITFSEIMDFYPEHNLSVYQSLVQFYQKGDNLIPFVGAGLSIFCGYLTWPDVLKTLSRYVYDSNKRKQIETMICKGELLQAAQEIHNNYPRMFRVLPNIISYEKIRNCDEDKLYASATYLLPYLFDKGLIMTTNFDRVLEEVYDKHGEKFEKIVTPYDLDLHTQMRQQIPHCLFKLHGDIGPEIHDTEKLVFTQTQYDTAYALDAPLIQELFQWFQNRKLLFLGCSLAKDKTMDVLQRVSKQNSELDHYAILACKPKDMSQRICEMGDLGISPIYYPDGKHDAVRVILERLLEETHSDRYQQCMLYTAQHTTVSKTERRFMYDSDYIAFTGRKREIAQLHDFCQSSEKISWWAVISQGGDG